jgi:hypothetical protein
MAIVVTLSPELETLLIERAARQGQEVNLDAGRFRDFQEFANGRIDELMVAFN